MPNFDELFQKASGKPVFYQNKRIYRVDQFQVSNGDTLLIDIVSTNSDFLQGISIGIFGSCEMEGKVYKNGKRINVLIWEEKQKAKQKIEVKVFSKNGFVYIKNIWEQNNKYLVSDEYGNPVEKFSKSVESWHSGAAMIIEEANGGKRYFCNDGKNDSDFDDIIFTIKNLG